MQDKKTIAVIGATGAQGGGLVRAILADPDSEFAVRAVTRNVQSDRAKDLSAQGAEVVAADLEDQGSLERAFRGAYGVYGVTNFWESFSPETEQRQARNLATAAKAAGVEHFVWSTLEDTRKWIPLEDGRMPTLMGKYKVPHFDAKGEADGFFRQLEVPTTFLLTCFYWDNLIKFGMGPKPGLDGNLAIAFPMDDKPLSGIAAEDIGGCAHGIFKAGESMIGKTVGIAGGHLTGDQMAEAMTKALGRKIVYHSMSPEAYRALGFPGAEDLGNMFQFYRDFADYFVGIRPVDEARKLNPNLKSFEDFLKAYGDQVPLP